MSTLLPKNVNVSKIKYSDVKSLSNGSKTVYINYGSGTEKLTIQIPVMHIPYGIGDGNYNPSAKKGDGKDKKIDDDAGEKKDLRYDLTVSFRGMDDNPKVKAFHDKMQEIERKIKDDAFANRLTWLRDDFDGMKAFTDKMFSPFVKYDKDKDTGKIIGKYPPTLKVKLPYDNKNDSFVFDSYDMDGNEIDFKTVMTKLKGAKTQLVIQLSGIWFAGGKYGCTWKVLMGKFQLPCKNKFTFLADSDDDTTPAQEHDDELEEDAMAMASNPSPQKPTKTPAASEDEDDDDDDVPPPPPQKKPELIQVSDAEDNDEDEAASTHDEEEDEEDDDPTPPPPPKRGAAKKTATKK